MDSPYFSIIVPVYNRAQFINTIVGTVQEQTFKNWELIIVDDASTDDTEKLVDTHIQNDVRIRYIKHETNQERGAARNTGVAEAIGRYICFLDSDDRFCDNHLSNFYSHIMKRKEPMALFFSNTYLSYNNKVVKKKSHFPLADWNKYGYILHHTYNPTRVCVHREILKEISFDIDIPGLEDLDLFLRIARLYATIQLTEYTNVYLIHDDAYSFGSLDRYEKELIYFKKIFAKEELKGLLPQSEKNRLLSKCHFFLANKCSEDLKFIRMYKHIITSFILFPKGYNGKTNKILAVLLLYNLPVIGSLFRSIKKLLPAKL